MRNSFFQRRVAFSSIITCIAIFYCHATSINANSEWTNTGITINQGETITITATGTWRSATWTPTPETWGPLGHGGGATGMRQYAHMCLIGKIGTSKFYVGSGGSFTATASGTLSLGPNDGPTADCWADNDGALSVEIQSNAIIVPLLNKSHKNAPQIRNVNSKIIVKLPVSAKTYNSKLQLFDLHGRLLCNLVTANTHEYTIPDEITKNLINHYTVLSIIVEQKRNNFLFLIVD